VKHIRISAREILEDLRAGMSDGALMEKYGLTPTAMGSVLRQLVEDQVLTRGEVYGARVCADEEGFPRIVRALERYAVHFEPPVFEQGNPDNRGRVVDVTEKGIGTRGLLAKVDEIGSFVVPGDEYDEYGAFRFEARCCWLKPDPDGNHAAGFEFTSISFGDLGQLRLLITLASLDM